MEVDWLTPGCFMVAGRGQQAGKVQPAGRRSPCSRLLWVTHASGVTGQTVGAMPEGVGPGMSMLLTASCIEACLCITACVAMSCVSCHSIIGSQGNTTAAVSTAALLEAKRCSGIMSLQSDAGLHDCMTLTLASKGMLMQGWSAA